MQARLPVGKLNFNKFPRRKARPRTGYVRGRIGTTVKYSLGVTALREKQLPVVCSPSRQQLEAIVRRAWDGGKVRRWENLVTLLWDREKCKNVWRKFPGGGRKFLRCLICYVFTARLLTQAFHTCVRSSMVKRDRETAAMAQLQDSR
jgi:hypothetical protein